MNSGDESEGSLEDILKQVEEQEKVCISTLAASITEHNPQSPYRWEISASVMTLVKRQIQILFGKYKDFFLVNVSNNICWTFLKQDIEGSSKKISHILFHKSESEYVFCFLWCPTTFYEG